MNYSEIAEPPTQLIMETVSVCNLRCPACHIGAQETNRPDKLPYMPMDLFEKVTDEAKAFIKHAYLHLWGEPTLNPNLGAMIRKTVKFASVDLATHGMFVTEELADDLALCETLSVSIDGITQEVYEKYRVRGNLEQAMRGLKILLRKAPQVRWTFIVFAHNEHQMEEAKRIAAELGAKIGFKPPCLIDPERQRDMLPKGFSQQRYEVVDGKLKLKADRLSCREFWHSIYVLPDGSVTTCCYDYDARMTMGNVKKNTLLEIWNGEKYREARRRHLSGSLMPMCESLCKLPS